MAVGLCSFLFIPSISFLYRAGESRGWDLDLGWKGKGSAPGGKEMDRNGFIHRVYMETGAHNGFLEALERDKRGKQKK